VNFAALLDGRVPWLSVRTGVAGPGWISCAAVLAEQRAGGDPTREWRATLQREYGADAPAQVAAMFVLMWYVGVPAYVAATALALTGRSPDVSPDGLAFRLHPEQHYPVGIALLPGPELSAERAAEVVRAHCGEFAARYRPGVKLSSLQRCGAVDDELRTALRACAGAPFAAEAARVLGVDPAVAVRDSCCFIYALPNASECAGCPRSR
jgi:hypothetical protein